MPGPCTRRSGILTFAALALALALALAGGAPAQTDETADPPVAMRDPAFGPVLAVRDPAFRRPPSRPADLSHWEWYQTVWGEPIRDLIDAAEGPDFDALQDRLGQVWLNADGAIPWEVSGDLVRLLARDVERALTWWLSHPGELDLWIEVLATTFVSNRDDGTDLPGLRALHSDVLASLDAFVGMAPWGRMREVAVCLGSEIAALSPRLPADHMTPHEDPVPPVSADLDRALVDLPSPLPAFAHLWDGDRVDEPPAREALGVAQGLDFDGAVRFHDLEAVELLRGGVVVVVIGGKRALAVVPDGVVRYLVPVVPYRSRPAICESRR